MLLHPKSRGGGDIEPTEFPEIGRWRHNRLLLTSEYDDNGTNSPSTGAVRQFFRDITPEVFASAQAATDPLVADARRLPPSDKRSAVTASSRAIHRLKRDPR